MSRFGFCGATYTAQSVNADCQLSMGWYPETDASGQGKSAVQMYPTPGTRIFTSLSGPSVRGQWTINGREFAVSGINLYEIFADGTNKNLGVVSDDGLPVSMTSSPQQLLIAAGGNCYVLTLATNALTAIPPATFNQAISQVEFCDGFFIALGANSQQIYASSPLDALTWPGTSTTIVSVFSDNVLSMKVDHRQIWLFGLKASVVYYDSGATPFPFDVVPGAFVEQGIIAMDSPVKLDNSVFWLGGDERGNLIAWRASGYTPTRVSNHAVENAWQNFATATDARAYAYQDRGHSFWVIYFPTANQTWVYDAATGSWHNRGFLNSKGTIDAHHSQNHAFIFGKHLVGDWSSGHVYDMNISYPNDLDFAIKRIRRAPHISTENQWMFHQSLEVSLESGLGPEPPLLGGDGLPRGPQVMLRWSDDGGHKWSNEHDASAGQAGEYRKRVIWRRLGRSRDRVYEISTTDAIPWRIVDAYLKADAAYKPQERLSDQLRKEA